MFSLCVCGSSKEFSSFSFSFSYHYILTLDHVLLVVVDVVFSPLLLFVVPVVGRRPRWCCS